MKERNSNIELLRFLSAIGILLGHSASKGQGIILSSGINNLFFHFCGSLANIGSMILAIISFYFMYDRTFSIKNALKIWFKTLFYYSVITVILLMFDYISIDKKVITYLLPIAGRPYWFVCAWLVFYFLRMMIDFFIKKIKNTKLVCMIVVTMFCFVPYFISNSVLTNELFYFVALYFLTIYCLHNANNIKFMTSSKRVCLIFILVTIISIGNWGINKIYNYKEIPYSTSSCFLSDSRSPFVIAIGIVIVYLLINMNKRNNAFISYLGGLSFGIYLFHCHPFIKNDLFYQVFKFEEYINTEYIYLLLVTMIIITIVSVMIMEYFENKLFEKIIRSHRVDEFITLFDKKYNEIFENTSS